MTEVQLPPAMAVLRPELGDFVASIEQRTPYGSIEMQSLAISPQRFVWAMSLMPRDGGPLRAGCSSATC